MFGTARVPSKSERQSRRTPRPRQLFQFRHCPAVTSAPAPEQQRVHRVGGRGQRAKDHFAFPARLQQHCLMLQLAAPVTRSIAEHVQSLRRRRRNQHIEATLDQQGFDGLEQHGAVINRQHAQPVRSPSTGSVFGFRANAIEGW